MSDLGNAGEVGGIFAGIVALLALIGKGIQWLLGYGVARADRRQAKLDAWHEELKERERKIDADQASHQERQAAYQARIEARLESFETWKAQTDTEKAALRTAYQLIASALRAIDPHNNALRMADELLKAAFPPDPVVPEAMEVLLGDIDEAVTDRRRKRPR